MKKYVIRKVGEEYGLFEEGKTEPVVIGPSPKKLAKAAWETNPQEVRHEYDGSKLPPEEK